MPVDPWPSYQPQISGSQCRRCVGQLPLALSRVHSDFIRCFLGIPCINACYQSRELGAKVGFATKAVLSKYKVYPTPTMNQSPTCKVWLVCIVISPDFSSNVQALQIPFMQSTLGSSTVTPTLLSKPLLHMIWFKDDTRSRRSRCPIQIVCAYWFPPFSLFWNFIIVSQ